MAEDTPAAVAEGALARVAQAAVLRLYPNPAQAAQMRQWIGAARALWNHLLALQKETYQRDKRFLSKKELEAERQRWEHEPDCEWRRAAVSHVRQRIVIELDKALRDFLASRNGKRKGPRLGFPRFKKRGPSGGFYLANTRFSVADGTDRVKLDKLGEVSFRCGRRPLGGILGARVKHEAGRWSMAVQFEGPPPRSFGNPSLPVLGIDVGLSAAVARSDGQIVPAPKFYRKAERRLRRLQRRVSHSQARSRRREVKVRQVARLLRRVRDKRRDFLHVRSVRAVGKAETVCVETLNIKAMGRRRTRRGKSVADAAMGELGRQIEYKAGWYGRRHVKIGQFEPTTKACSACGTIHEMPLWRRVLRCGCGLVIDRDLNAARNIAGLGAGMVGGVTAEPASESSPTRAKRGVQTAAAGPSRSVPLDETRSRLRRLVRQAGLRGRGPDIPVTSREENGRKVNSRGPAP